jgi:type I restriction enzyme M protein
LWSYCNILRDDGLSYPDYVEQLTYLLFLKMAQERQISEPQSLPIAPAGFDWASLVVRSGAELHDHYSKVLTNLGEGKGMLGLIFRGAENKIRDPAKLRLLIVDLIDQRNWSALDADVKGDAYEGLLEKNAQDTKSGAGQYFTPRPLVQAVVDCVRPQLGETIHDPACGTGGFLLAAHEFVQRENPDRTEAQERHLRLNAIHGAELVHEVTRLGAMNLLLHGIGSVDGEGVPPIRTGDTLASHPGRTFDVVLTNPPFGKSSVTVVTDASIRNRGTLTITRPDFWASTSNKQLAFLQHIATILGPRGRAAVVLPDGALSEGGAGETIRRRLMDEFDVHTLLRLPTGIFYATGVTASVLFFDRKAPSKSSATRRLWIYDLRTNQRFTFVNNRMYRAVLDDFVKCYNPLNRTEREETWSSHTPEGRWRSFAFDELVVRDQCNLDIMWIKDKDLDRYGGDESLDDLSKGILADLRSAMAQFEELLAPSKR